MPLGALTSVNVPSPLFSEQVVRDGLELVRVAVSAPIRLSCAAEPGPGGETPVQISADEKVQKAVVVVVHEAGATGPAFGGQAGLLRPIRRRRNADFRPTPGEILTADISADILPNPVPARQVRTCVQYRHGRDAKDDPAGD